MLFLTNFAIICIYSRIIFVFYIFERHFFNTSRLLEALKKIITET